MFVCMNVCKAIRPEDLASCVNHLEDSNSYFINNLMTLSTGFKTTTENTTPGFTQVSLLDKDTCLCILNLVQVS